MRDIFNTYRPDGFGTVNSYLFASDPEALITFLKVAFFAIEKNRTIREDNGDLANCILAIGDSSVMISQARGEFEGMRASFYLYIADVDQFYQNALDQGAEDVFPPADMDYGDRQAGVKDPAGNYWWISTRFVHEDYKD